MNAVLRAAPAWITGYGLTTSVGGNTAQSCASMRAGVVRFLQSERYACAALDPANQPPEPALYVPVEELDPEEAGVDRLVSLALGAIGEAIESAQLQRRDLEGYALLLALPASDRPGAADLETRVAAELIRRGALPKPAKTLCSRAGQSGLPELLAQAVPLLEQQPLFLLVAVDSLIDPATMAWFDTKDRLKCTRSPEGIIAGEAAAAFVIEAPRTAERAKRAPRATLDALGLGVEKATVSSDVACVGLGYCDAVRAAAAALPKSPNPPWVVLDHNGERYRALEWSYVLTRLHAIFREASPSWYFADSVGETGAAAGGLAAARVLAAFERGYAPSEQAWILLGGDPGSRAAFVLGSPRRGA